MNKLFLTGLLSLAIASCGAPENEDDYIDPPSPPVPIDNRRAVPPNSELDCPKGTRYTYENFGEAFLLSYCTMCHSQGLAGDDRSGAPEDVNFDTARSALAWRTQIISSAAGKKASMPPAQHVPKEERSQLSEWLNCGAPGQQDRISTEAASTSEETEE